MCSQLMQKKKKKKKKPKLCPFYKPVVAIWRRPVDNHLIKLARGSLHTVVDQSNNILSKTMWGKQQSRVCLTRINCRFNFFFLTSCLLYDLGMRVHQVER